MKYCPAFCYYLLKVHCYPQPLVLKYIQAILFLGRETKFPTDTKEQIKLVLSGAIPQRYFVSRNPTRTFSPSVCRLPLRNGPAVPFERWCHLLWAVYRQAADCPPQCTREDRTTRARMPTEPQEHS